MAVPATLGGLEARALDDADVPALQDLLERCADFVLLDEGEPPGPDAARETLAAVPPGHSLDDRLVVGLAEAGATRLVGVLGLLRGYPTREAWWIGLFLLDPSVRRRGIGAAVVADTVAWLRREGCGEVLLAVLERNPDAQRFWERAGFAVLDRRPRKGPRPDPCVRMLRRLGDRDFGNRGGGEAV